VADVGLTHVALTVTNVDASIAFYERYAQMRVVHRRHDEAAGRPVVWLSDHTRPFVIVLIEVESVDTRLGGVTHLGIGCASRDEVDRLCALALEENRLRLGPIDAGYPVGYFAFVTDPDGHNLELSYGQEVGLAVETAERPSSGQTAEAPARVRG
jgi:catechol 2,3-dioxygenase-like lactoylglutathione lyase family enzyme